MEKLRLYENYLLNFKSYTEFIFLVQPLIILLSMHFDEIKQKLESETDIIKFIYFNRSFFHKVLYDREEVAKISLESKKALYTIIFI